MLYGCATSEPRLLPDLCARCLALHAIYLILYRCVASGRGCYPNGGGHNYAPYKNAGILLLGRDWLFAGGSDSTSAMADAVLRFHELVHVQTGHGDGYVSTHFMWPFHAATTPSIRLRWGLQLELDLARNVRDVDAALGDRRGAARHGVTCYDNTTSLRLEGRYEGALLPGMRDACPYETVLVCRHASPQQPCMPRGMLRTK